MVEFLEIYLPICINILLIILLVIGIILGVRLIGSIDKVDEILNNVENKVNSLNGFFNVLDFTTDKIASFGDRIMEIATGIISKIGKKRNNKEEDDYE